MPDTSLSAGFLAERPRLLSIAHRILGSIHDAEDAVQTAWLRMQTSSGVAIDSVPAWLTTVVTRVCIDQLRERSRRETLADAPAIHSDAALAADEAFLLRDDVSRALMVLLASLTPPQRVAYVLHDLFAVPFERIAEILDTTPASAKKHASRARSRIGPKAPSPAEVSVGARHDDIVTAFLQAAAGGDMSRMLTLMAPDCVRIVDASLVPAGTAVTVSGATAVAEETRRFADRIRASIPMRVNGRAVHVIAPGGHPIAAIDVTADAGVVTRITIAPISTADVIDAVARQVCEK
ncbi:sigma-70 family RNA polymerase sigma factor [Mycolicibacterium iranicum]|uniref:RNA polymerase subunit sigma-70 n=1 Tax=Mycolicibacterium iranicum TaxID=912594 RepID=A0A1X1WUA7_MYCIR|nr:sigma-70 family RNA polymerase sigma factor [Mycolicibacterium iranicum]MCZ0730866.1 sigma-70 family RNA polymerase sigma factor [Mycolicibacterium iranicum]ORV90164.1 RNA polymerase subunit sigma-70 [Mycolicibacterium iranicum]